MQKSRLIRVNLLNGVFCFLMLSVSACATSAERPTVATSQQNTEKTSLPAPSTQKSVGSEEPQQYTGNYLNPTFGFSVVIPQGLTGKGEPEPQPQHGFVIVLSSEDRATLSIAGNYNAALWNSLDEAYDHLYSYTSEGAKSVTLLEKRKDLMDTLPAIRFSIRYVKERTDVARIRSELISIRKCTTSDVQVINTIVLDTSEHRFQEDRLLMDNLLKTWKILETCG